MKTIIFTGGGTAGHVMPNLALMDRLDKNEWTIHYIGTQEGIEHELLQKRPEVIYHAIAWGKLRRYFSWKNFTDPFRVVKGYFQSRRIMKDVKPDVLFSKGGQGQMPRHLPRERLLPGPGQPDRIEIRGHGLHHLRGHRPQGPRGQGRPHRHAHPGRPVRRQPGEGPGLHGAHG